MAQVRLETKRWNSFLELNDPNSFQQNKFGVSKLFVFQGFLAPVLLPPLAIRGVK